MATLPQQNLYQCDRCGSASIVAVSLLYQQGTHSYAGTLHSGISQSVSAQVAAPPKPRGYLRPILVWGFGIYFALFWGYAGLSSLSLHPNTSASSVGVALIFLLLGLALLIVLVFNLRRLARYNREIFPQILSNWQHTYMCRKCGTTRLITE